MPLGRTHALPTSYIFETYVGDVCRIGDRSTREMGKSTARLYCLTRPYAGNQPTPFCPRSSRLLAMLFELLGGVPEHASADFSPGEPFTVGVDMTT